jgi:hypothetical protein
MKRSKLQLGELIDALKATINPEYPDKAVRFDFGGIIPTKLDSYRGFYEQAALGYETEPQAEDALLKDLIAHLEGRIGESMEGYKGGRYDIDRETWVWAANVGYATRTAIVGVEDLEYMTIINTEYHDS